MPAREGRSEDRSSGREAENLPWWRKLGWFVAIWVMSVAVLGIVAYAIRLALL